MRLLALLICMGMPLLPVHAVDRSKFRTCQDTSFCRLHRAPLPGTAAAAASSLTAIEVRAETLQVRGEEGALTCTLSNDLFLSVHTLVR